MTTIHRIVRRLAGHRALVFLLVLLLPLLILQTHAPRQAVAHAPVEAKNSLASGVATGNTQIPVDTPDYDMDVETWWATHPFNPESSNYIPVGGIVSPEPVINVRSQYGGNIQAAIDALPPTGGTLYFDPGAYTNTFQLVAKSNVHFVSQGDAILSGGPSWVVGCQQALDYSRIAAQVHSHYPEAIACVTINRIQNIYFKNITFDGDGSAQNAINLSAANGVLFDNVVFQNFSDSSIPYLGIVAGNVNVQNIWLRGAHFAGKARWAMYLDGAHFSGVVQSRIDYNFDDMDSSSGGLLYMTNADLNGDYDQNGAFEPHEKRNANHIVIAHNTFGADGGASMHTAIVMNGTNILIEKNTVLRYVYRFALFMGKCDTINPGVDMRFYNLKVIGNRTKGTDIFTHVDGGNYACDLQNNTMGVGKYVVRDNVIDAQSLPALVWETNPPIQGPNIIENNCVGGKLYGTSIDCEMLSPRSSVLLPLILSGPD